MYMAYCIYKTNVSKYGIELRCLGTSLNKGCCILQNGCLIDVFVQSVQ